MTRRCFAVWCVAVALSNAIPHATNAQGATTGVTQTQPRDTFFLDALQLAAESTDRRAAQIELLGEQVALRLQTIRNERLPSLNSAASAQYFSDVASVAGVLGNNPALSGLRIPTPYRDQYDASITARQPVYDATRARRAAVESAVTNESVARTRAAIWQQRQVVNDAFFAVQLFAAQSQALDAAIVDLTARRTAAQQRVSAGSALPSEVLLLEAEILRRTQSRNELQAQRSATQELLVALTGFPISPTSVFAVRSASPALPAADAAAQLRARPEYLTFDRQRETITARSAELAARDLPRVSAFGRAGYGRPGLNPLGRSFDTYWNAGLQLEWSPFNYGRTKRDLQSQTLQSRMVEADEAQFSESVRRAAISQRGQIAAFEQSIAMDDSLVALRDRVLRETRLRFDEGEVTSAEFISRQVELLNAQLERDTRRVRLDEARARYLTTIGREVR